MQEGVAGIEAEHAHYGVSCIREVECRPLALASRPKKGNHSRIVSGVASICVFDSHGARQVVQR